MKYTWFIQMCLVSFLFIFIFFLRALGSSCHETEKTTTEAPTFLKRLQLYFFQWNCRCCCTIKVRLWFAWTSVVCEKNTVLCLMKIAFSKLKTLTWPTIPGYLVVYTQLLHSLLDCQSASSFACADLAMIGVEVFELTPGVSQNLNFNTERAISKSS